MTSENNSNVNGLATRYNTVRFQLLDKHAPIRTSTVAERTIVPWMTDAILEANHVGSNMRRFDALLALLCTGNSTD